MAAKILSDTHHTGLVSEEDLAVYGVQRGNQQVAAPLLVQDPV